MNLARTLGIYWLALAWLTPAASALQGQQTASQVDSSPQASPSQPQSIDPTKVPPVEKKVDSAGPAKPSPQRRHRHKKQTLPNCTDSATVLNSGPAGPAASGNPTAAGTASSVPASVNSDSSSAGSAKSASAEASPAKSDSSTLPPCAPPKKVIPNGGSDEPSIQLLGGSPAEQASNQRSTEQLIAATEENLRKIAERRLPNSQETVNQIKQFIDQSKTAVAKGDAERAHNLAQKAHLLSQELLKP